jgi:poly-gamma-glutamate biosynthesis protein PgsC/CapC
MPYESVLVGLVLAVLFVEVFGIYPGGIIVPAYLALHLGQPLRLLATLAAALLSLAVYRALSRRLLLFGKRRFVLMVLLGALISQLWFLVFPSIFPSLPGLRVIGWVIPGLLANQLERQRALPTLAGLLIVMVLTAALSRLFFGG